MAINFINSNRNNESDHFRNEFFPNATNDDWNDWHWQLKNRITNIEQLERIINLSEDERAALSCPVNALPLSITPYYASLLDKNNPKQALRKTVVPVINETIF